MKTIRGHFNGSSVELLEDSPVADRSYVLVTFLDGNLQLAVARGQLRSRDVIAPPPGAAERTSADIYRRFTVGALMTRDIVTMPPTASLLNATHLMRQKGITSVIVEPNARGEWGIVTMRDVLKQVVAEDRPREDLKLDEIASRPLVTTTPEMSLRDCARLLVEKNIRRVVVMNDTRPVGIISDTDIFLFVEEHGWG